MKKSKSTKQPSPPKEGKSKYNKPLKIDMTFGDVMALIVKGNPKSTKKK